MKGAAFILLVVFGSVGPTASAQSLGEIAQKEKERRQSVQRTTPVKVYGQNDVKTVTTTDDTSVVEGGLGKESAVARVETPAAPDPQAAEQPVWRSKADAIRAEIDAADRNVKAMEALGTGYAIPPDGLVQARNRLAAAKLRMDQLEDDARRRGIPPGWVR